VFFYAQNGLHREDRKAMAAGRAMIVGPRSSWRGPRTLCTCLLRAFRPSRLPAHKLQTPFASLAQSLVSAFETLLDAAPASCKDLLPHGPAPALPDPASSTRLTTEEAFSISATTSLASKIGEEVFF